MIALAAPQLSPAFRPAFPTVSRKAKTERLYLDAWLSGGVWGTALKKISLLPVDDIFTCQTGR